MMMMKLGVLTIFKNESVNLREWVDHYIWQGAGHIWMIDNNSTDKPLRVLQSYIDSGMVTYIYGPNQQKQVEYYRQVYPSIRECCEWCLIADLDEFWFCPDGVALKDHLDKEKVDVICTDWVMFGSSGWIDHPPSIRSGFTKRWPSTEKTQQKYVFRTLKVDPSQIHVHYCTLNGKVVSKKDNETYVLNHYAIQSYGYFTSVKMTRGDVLTTVNPRNRVYFRAYDRLATIEDSRLKSLLIKLAGAGGPPSLHHHWSQRAPQIPP